MLSFLRSRTYCAFIYLFQKFNFIATTRHFATMPAKIFVKLPNYDRARLLHQNLLMFAWKKKVPRRFSFGWYSRECIDVQTKRGGNIRGDGNRERIHRTLWLWGYTTVRCKSNRAIFPSLFLLFFILLSRGITSGSTSPAQSGSISVLCVRLQSTRRSNIYSNTCVVCKLVVRVRVYGPVAHMHKRRVHICMYVHRWKNQHVRVHSMHIRDAWSLFLFFDRDCLASSIFFRVTLYETREISPDEKKFTLIWNLISQLGNEVWE